MLASHFRIAREGLHPFRLMRKEYEDRGRRSPHGRKFISGPEFLRRVEPLMPLIAAGELPYDATTAHIVQANLEAEHKMFQKLLDDKDGQE